MVCGNGADESVSNLFCFACSENYFTKSLPSAVNLYSDIMNFALPQAGVPLLTKRSSKLLTWREREVSAF